MSFPLSPTDGQQASINGVTYVYSSALTAWTVSTGFGGTFLNISVTDTVNSGNLVVTGLASVTGNITVGNVVTVGIVSATGNVTGSNLIGTVATAAQPNITSVGSLGNTQISSLGIGTTASGNVGEIRATDNITAYFSDRRLKEITGTIPDAIYKVMSLSGVQFTNNDRAAEFGYTSQHAQVGVIAQEVQRVLPEAVVPAPFDIATDAHGVEISRTGQHYLTVQYEKIIPLLIEAIKQQQFMIQELQQRMD
jgi:hypothetical protein